MSGGKATSEDLCVIKVDVLADWNVLLVVELNLEIRGGEIALVLDSVKVVAKDKKRIIVE